MTTTAIGERGSRRPGDPETPRPATRGEGGRRPGEGILVALLVLVTIITLSFSWNRWLDPIIDTGRDLYISEQLAHGTKLYRDIRYQYPPLAPYLLAAITAAIGSSLAAFTAIGLAQSLVIAALLWLAVRSTAGLVTALLFLSLSFTGASTWGANFIFPYSYAATLGIALLLGALVAFLRGRHSTAIALLVAASWMKVEYAIGVPVVERAALRGDRKDLRTVLLRLMNHVTRADERDHQKP